MKKQQGFTLIELMIVVAVIGVLSAIAIPQYQKYVAKAEAASALATLTGLKTNAEAYTVENGAFPNSASAGINALLGTPSAAVGSIVYAPSGTDGAGTITVTFDGEVSALIKDETMRLNRDTSGGWTCTSKSTMDAGIKPKGCSATY